MKTLVQTNMAAHPAWYVNPKSLTAEEKRFLAWQALQPNIVGPGTIGEAWEASGTGPYYFSHVSAAREQIALYASRNQILKEAGRPPIVGAWNLTKTKGA